MANQILLGRALDANGYIAPGAKATIYADGTSTLITVYSDVDGTTPAANPIIADGDGFWPQRYVTEDAKVVVTDANDVALYTLDPAPTAAGTGRAASAISFTPTVQLPQTNVQAAIEAAGALAVSGFAAFGLGVTGNATLLADLDATGTGAGIYRFDGTTTGTFPTGVAAGDTGMVELWRQSGATAMMELHHATSNRVFRRRLAASVWGTWREVINVNQATAEGDIVYRGASDWVRLPKGTARQVLAMNSGATAPAWVSAGGWTEMAVAASTSGTSIDFSSIPAGVSDIEIWKDGVSYTGTDYMLIQLGTGGSPTTTGYTADVFVNGAVVSPTSGFPVFQNTAVRAINGASSLHRINSDVWIWSFAGSVTTSGAVGGGRISLAGSLDLVRITSSLGVQTFDAGQLKVRYR